MMTNEELSQAIQYAFQCCDKTYVGGYSTDKTDAGKRMFQHLGELLNIQVERAKLNERETK